MFDKTEVSDLDVSIGLHQDVLRLEVTEDHALSVQILQAEHHLRQIELSHLGIELCELVDNLHKISVWHKVEKHVHDAFVLRHRSQVEDERVLEHAHALDLVQDMLGLFVLNQLILALDLHGHYFVFFHSQTVGDFHVPVHDVA